jgi:hypothetical protein
MTDYLSAEDRAQIVARRRQLMQDMIRLMVVDRKRLLLIPGAGHNDLLLYGRTRYFEAIAAFIR